MAGIFRSTNSLVPGNVAGFHERELKDQFGEERKQYQQTLASLKKAKRFCWFTEVIWY